MPIYWNMDSSLALYPLPDLIVVGDPSKPFEIQHHGCTVVNTVRCFNEIFAFISITNLIFFRAPSQNQSSRSKYTSHLHES